MSIEHIGAQVGNYIQEHPEIISGIAAAAGLFFTARTLIHQKKQDEIKLIESVFKDVRELEKELSEKTAKLVPDDVNYAKAISDWDSRFFNTLEWLSFLINEHEVKNEKLVGFFKPAIIAWYDNVFAKHSSDAVKKDPEQYPELKKLYQQFKNRPLVPKPDANGSSHTHPSIQPRIGPFVDIETSSVLQINATVIAGLLILFSISGSLLPSSAFEVSPPTSNNQTEIMQHEADKALSHAGLSVDRYGVFAIAFVVLIPFVVSSISTLFVQGKQTSIIFMIAGFAWLIIVLGIVVISNQNAALSQFKEAIDKYNTIPR